MCHFWWKFDEYGIFLEIGIFCSKMCPKDLENKTEYIKLKVVKVKVVLDFRSDESHGREGRFSPFTCGKWNIMIKILAILVKLLVAAQILIKTKKQAHIYCFNF